MAISFNQQRDFVKVGNGTNLCHSTVYCHDIKKKMLSPIQVEVLWLAYVIWRKWNFTFSQRLVKPSMGLEAQKLCIDLGEMKSPTLGCLGACRFHKEDDWSLELIPPPQGVPCSNKGNS